LPFSPNSILFENAGSNAYLGVDSSVLGTKGLMIFNGSAVSQFTGTPGKVLAVSPDRTVTIIADTVDTPNQIFICTNCTSSSRTVTSFLVDKATAAAFSPDSLKAYVVTASKCPGTLSAGCLLVYSKVDGPKLLTLTTPEDDVTFFPEGGFAYFAESGTPTIAARHTCDDSSLPSIPTAAAPAMVRALPDNATLLVLDPPYMQLVNVSGTFTGCTPTVNNTIVGTFDLGQGNFTPSQLIVSPDGTAAYVLGKTSPTTPFPFIIQFNIQNQTSSLLTLGNGAVPLSASLTPTGDLLFVGANDGTVHVLDTASGLDGQPITFPFPTNELCFGPGSPPTRVPLTVVDVTGASQSGSNTTFTYMPISGPALQLGQTIVVAGMKDPGNIGTFTITALGTGTFTVTNSLGVSDTGQSGTGTVPITCNPDIVAVKP
jgi:WD40 repeat protein